MYLPNILKYIRDYLIPEETIYVNLLSWIKVQRLRYKSQSMPLNQINALEKLSLWKWHTTVLSWDSTYEILDEYTKKFNHMPDSKECYKDINLGIWVYTQKRKYKNHYKDKNLDNISAYRIKKLEQILYWTWDINISWQKKYKLLCKFVNTYSRFPHSREVYKHIKLGRWVVFQRQLIKNNKQSYENELLLRSIVGWKD